MDEAKTPRQGIQSVETGMQILNALADAGRPPARHIVIW